MAVANTNLLELLGKQVSSLGLVPMVLHMRQMDN